MSQPKCENCGALMNAGWDPRFADCSYCGQKARVTLDGKDIAAGLQLDLGNIETFLRGLVDGLHGHFGERTRLEMEREHIRLFEINLDPDLFVVKREPHGMVAQHKKLVRGVALKTNTHPLDRWVELLARSLAAHANENARVASILSQIKKV